MSDSGTSLEAAAAREGLHGWVRNLPDGRVEITAEGDAEAIERFERQREAWPGLGAALATSTWKRRLRRRRSHRDSASVINPEHACPTWTISRTKIRNVPDFPKPGILFYDITTLLQDPAGFRAAIDSLALPFKDQGIEIVVGIESRGFIFGAAVADRHRRGLHAGAQAWQAAVDDRCGRPTRSSTAPTRSKSTTMPCSKGSGC